MKIPPESHRYLSFWLLLLEFLTFGCPPHPESRQRSSIHQKSRSQTFAGSKKFLLVIRRHSRVLCTLWSEKYVPFVHRNLYTWITTFSKSCSLAWKLFTKEIGGRGICASSVSLFSSRFYHQSGKVAHGESEHLAEDIARSFFPRSTCVMHSSWRRKSQISFFQNTLG